jgi:hypothetical protein
MNQSIVVRWSRHCRSSLFVVAALAWFCLATPRVVGATQPEPCSPNSDSRQLDFWLGNWTVTYPGASAPSASRVYLDLDQCLLVESWDGGKGHSGKNMFAYSSDDKTWHGMFADNQGRVHVFEGKVAPGSAEFTGPSRGPNGESVLNKIKVVRVNANKVEQSWEKSRDNGDTWTMEFQGEYLRTNP